MLRSIAWLAVVALLAGNVTAATIIPAEKEHVISLNGTWRFRLEKGSAAATPEDVKNFHAKTSAPATSITTTASSGTYQISPQPQVLGRAQRGRRPSSQP